MRLASFEHKAGKTFGVVAPDGLFDLKRRGDGRWTSLRDLLEHDGITQIGDLLSGARPDYSFDEITWLPAIPDPSQILCVGLNYRAHAEEVGRPMEKVPVIFLRVPGSQTGHLKPIVRPKVSQSLDYEGELAVVIGKRGRYVTTSNAFRQIAGYSLYNDASLRDWQRHTHQYTPGKNFPATGAFGPWIVTTDEIRDPTELVIRTRLNGDTVQQAPLSELIFSIPDIISYVSNFTELQPGDVVITGTPAGVGAMRKPPRWMLPGDVVEVEIAEIGTLRNPIIEEH